MNQVLASIQHDLQGRIPWFHKIEQQGERGIGIALKDELHAGLPPRVLVTITIDTDHGTIALQRAFRPADITTIELANPASMVQLDKYLEDTGIRLS